jgi:hypothetical protein
LIELEPKKKKKVKAEKKIIGRKEKIDLPEFGLVNLDAKIDTGAYTSSLHCRIKGESVINGTAYVCFIPLAKKYRARHAREIMVPITKRKVVKSSSGHAEERYFVTLQVSLAGMLIETEFSLTDRSSMKHTILLGRKFLKNRFIVDVSKQYIFYNQWKTRKLALKKSAT